MIYIFYDNCHSLRFDVLNSAFNLININCSKFEFKLSQFFYFHPQKNIILIAHPANYLKCLILSMIYFLSNYRIVLDFYDLNLVRKNKIKKTTKLKFVEIILIYFADCFISRSGELNYLKKKKT